MAGESDRLARRRGVGHLERTDEDLGLLRDLGVNAYRFSLEWSRIVPRPGEWDESAMERYRRMAAGLREAGVEPVVTLHHFTNPAWLGQRGSWADEAFLEEFVHFARRALTALRGIVRLYVTINEPNVAIAGGFLGGVMPPGRQSFSLAFAAFANMMRAHAAAYDLVHSLAVEPVAAGPAHNMLVFAPASAGSARDRWVTRLTQEVYNLGLLHALRTGSLRARLPLLEREEDVGTRGKADFVGVNYYTRAFLRFSPTGLRGTEYVHEDRTGRGLTDTGWEVYPEGFRQVLDWAASAGFPLLVTENGAAERDPERKVRYLQAHLEALESTRAAGVDVRGYFWWSLLDNYEWLHGLGPRFGLYHVDFDTLDRRPTPAARFYASWIAKQTMASPPSPPPAAGGFSLLS